MANSSYACGAGGQVASLGSRETDMLVDFLPEHKANWYSFAPI